MSDQTTNDEQAGHTTKPGRDSLLIELRRAARQVCRDQWCEGGSQLTLAMDVADGLHQFIQSKITSGELRVVKAAKDVGMYGDFQCDRCNTEINWGGVVDGGHITANDVFRFCPGCGSKIVG